MRQFVLLFLSGRCISFNAPLTHLYKQHCTAYGTYLRNSTPAFSPPTTAGGRQDFVFVVPYSAVCLLLTSILRTLVRLRALLTFTICFLRYIYSVRPRRVGVRHPQYLSVAGHRSRRSAARNVDSSIGHLDLLRILGAFPFAFSASIFRLQAGTLARLFIVSLHKTGEQVRSRELEQHYRFLFWHRFCFRFVYYNRPVLLLPQGRDARPSFHGIAPHRSADGAHFTSSILRCFFVRRAAAALPTNARRKHLVIAEHDR